MKLSFLLISIFLFFIIVIIDAASIKNLSEKLMMENLDKNTKEKVPNDELILSEMYGNENDGEVSELNNLKFVKEDKSEDLKTFDENPESSLKKLRNSDLKGSKLFMNTKQIDIEHGLNHQKSKSQKENFDNPYIPNEKIEFSYENKKIQKFPKDGSIINPYTMLRESNDKYSAYEIAQYIFWTGDEKGIANAVEELIDEGLMTRENAVEFLKDIRLGIDYMENKYKTDKEKKHLTQTVKTISKEPSEFESKLKTQRFYKNFEDKEKSVDHDLTRLSSMMLKAFEKVPSFEKLNEIHPEHKNVVSLFDKNLNNLKVGDFPSEEYTLEKVIYQLAKTMFSQSLNNGSDSQVALQKLTQFLENEGKHERISPILEKKILDLLLVALSDTLSENPELLKNTIIARNE